MAGRNKNYPWWEPFAEEELLAWKKEDPERLKAYGEQKWQEWLDMESRLPKGHPNPLAFQYQSEDEGYRAAVEAYRDNRQAQMTAQALDSVLQAHKPPPPPPDIDFSALSSRNAQDRKTGAEILRSKQFISDQLRKAALQESLGNPEKAQAARERAAMMTREIEKTRSERRYTFLEEADAQLVDHATRELEEAMKLSPSEVEERREYWEGLCKTFNATNPGEFSFVIDRPSPYARHDATEGRIRKIHHPGLRANEVHQRAEGHNQDILDYLFIAGHKPEKGPIEESQQLDEKVSQERAETNARLEGMNQAEFEQARNEAGAPKF